MIAGFAFYQTGRAFIEHPLAGLFRQRLNAHIAVQNILNIVVIEDVFAAPGQAQAGTADDN